MEKVKLIEKRKAKGLSQSEIADKLHMDVSNYCRRENGQKKIAFYEWEKLAKILDAPIGDIYESEDNQVFICKDNTTVHYQGTNIVYSTSEFLLETLKEYIEKLEKENQELKLKLEKRK